MRVLIVIALLGCGGQRPETSDAATNNDAIDAPAPGTVFVTVRSPTRLDVLAGAPVVFIDANGTTEAYTDASGHAEGIVLPGASVTVMFDSQHLATIVDVQPGDQLTFGAGRIVNGGDLAVSFTAYSSSAQYRVFTPCFSHPVTPPTTTVFLDLCAGPINNTEVYVVAYVSDVPVASAGAHGVDLTTGAVAITDAWTPLRSLRLDYAGVPGNIGGYFYDVPQGYSVGGSITGTSKTLSVPASSSIQLVHTDVAMAYAHDQSFSDRISAATNAYQLGAGVMRPWITSVTYDATTRTVSSVAPATLTGDVVDYFLTWGDVQNPYTWDIYAPTFAPRTLPMLPADVPDPSTIADGTAFVTLFDTPAIDGWDNVRPHVYDVATGAVDPAMVFDHMYQQLCGP